MEILLHSIVIPVYRSKDILKSTVSRISEVMEKANLDYELIMIDDGSQDGSYEEIKCLAEKYDSIRGFRLSRNFGHQAALVIGLSKTKGDYVAIIDDDLQDPPEVLL
ncbi:MAG: glycosyltransferase, partial [Candidatus Zixiibacteriota bacterium]